MRKVRGRIRRAKNNSNNKEQSQQPNRKTAGVGGYSDGSRNESGWRLLRIRGRRWTWIAPNQESESRIYYIITTRKESKTRDFDVISSFEFHSDHRLISCKMRIKEWHYREKKDP